MRWGRHAFLTMALAIAPAVYGETFINFNIPSTGALGSINYNAATGGSLVGSGITVSQITGLNTPLNAGAVSCVGCVLNYSSGPALSASASSWTFTGGAAATSFSVVGGVPAAGIPSGSTLLTGYFSSGTVTAAGFGSFRFIGAALIDAKHTSLVDYFMGSGYSAANTNIFAGNYVQQFTASSGAAPSYYFNSTTILDGHVSNLVPEPSAVILFGTVAGLIGIALLRRKRQPQS